MHACMCDTADLTLKRFTNVSESDTTVLLIPEDDYFWGFSKNYLKQNICKYIFKAEQVVSSRIIVDLTVLRIKALQKSCDP